MNLIAKYNNTEKTYISKTQFYFVKINLFYFLSALTPLKEEKFLFDYLIINKNTCVRKIIVTKIEKINGVAIYHVKHFSGVEMKLLKDGFFYLFD